jgi:hypothetical protein
MTNDAPIVLKPELISFDAVKVGDQHVLKINYHTSNLGVFTVTATPIQAEMLAASLWSYSEQVAEYEREHATNSA